MIRTLPLVLLLGCASAPTLPPTVPITRRVETAELPPNPRTEALPEGLPSGEWVEPAEVGQTLTHSGLLVSEARAARDHLFRLRYDELRVLYESDRRVWGAHRELYEGQIAAGAAALQAQRPSWFERNAGALGLGAGLVLGVALTAVSLAASH